MLFFFGMIQIYFPPQEVVISVMFLHGFDNLFNVPRYLQDWEKFDQTRKLTVQNPLIFFSLQSSTLSPHGSVSPLEKMNPSGMLPIHLLVL